MTNEEVVGLANGSWQQIVPGVDLIQHSGNAAPVSVVRGEVVALPFPGQWRVRATPLPVLTGRPTVTVEDLRTLPIGTVMRSTSTVLHLAWRVVEALWVVTSKRNPILDSELLTLSPDWDVVALIPIVTPVPPIPENEL